MTEPTKREAAVLNLFRSIGECNEGLMLDLWPLIRRPRTVTNSLLTKGFVTMECWIDDEAGYALQLTQAGREWLEAQS